jgi:hypothetical protein
MIKIKYIIPIFTLFLFSTSSGDSELLEKLSSEHLKNRKNYVKMKDGKPVGYKIYKESYLRPDLDLFIKKLIKIADKKDLVELKKVYNKISYLGEVEQLSPEQLKKFWRDLKFNLERGGCFSGSIDYSTYEYRMPYATACFRFSREERGMESKHEHAFEYYDQEIKIYEKFNLNSKYQVIEKGIVFSLGTVKECLKLNLINCYDDWYSLKTTYDIEGYVRVSDLKEKYPEQQIILNYDQKKKKWEIQQLVTFEE